MEGGFSKIELYLQEIYIREDLRSLYIKRSTLKKSLCMKKVENTHKEKVTWKIMTNGNLIPLCSQSF